MSNKTEILFLAHRIPYPPNKGDKIRSWRLLKHLTKNFDVHLACFVDDEGDFQHEAFLKSVCASVSLVRLRPKIALLKSARGLFFGEPLSVSYYRSGEMLNTVNALRKKDLSAEVIFSSTMAQYVEEEITGRARIVDFCDADSAKWAQYATDMKPPMSWVYRREGLLLERDENTIANWADHSFAVTPAEATLFNDRQSITRNVDWWSNGVDTDYFYPQAPQIENSKSSDVIFTGAMDYRANVDAVRYFVETVWPLLRKQKPDARFVVVGANPTKEITALQNIDGVKVTGRVDDVRPYIWAAKTAVAPLRIARGVQNKVLEAMACAKPVVATSAAAAGIACDPAKDIIVADQPDDMADEIAALLADQGKAQKIGEAARETVLQDYQWDEQLSRFDDKLSQSLQTYSSSA